MNAPGIAGGNRGTCCQSGHGRFSNRVRGAGSGKDTTGARRKLDGGTHTMPSHRSRGARLAIPAVDGRPSVRRYRGSRRPPIGQERVHRVPARRDHRPAWCGMQSLRAGRWRCIQTRRSSSNARTPTDRRGDHEVTSFTFLGYVFRLRYWAAVSIFAGSYLCAVFARLSLPNSGHTAARRASRACVCAVVGVVVAAIAAACLVVPATQRLATPAGVGSAAAILGIPVVLILAVSGYPAYGAARSMAVAVVVALVTCAVSWVVVALALGSALSGTLSTKTDIGARRCGVRRSGAVRVGGRLVGAARGRRPRHATSGQLGYFFFSSHLTHIPFKFG